MPVPSDSQRRVAITGTGVVSPLGNSVAEMWEALCNQQSGVAPLTRLPRLEDRICFGGEARQFEGTINDFGPLPKDLKKAIRKALKVMCRETMMAVAAAQQALSDAGLDEQDKDPERSGVVFGSDYMLSPPEDFEDGMAECGAADGEFRFPEWGGAGLDKMNPLWMLKFLPNMPGSHIAIFNDFRGPNNSLTLREVSGTLAIREAVQTIQRGHADRMLAGATGTRIHPFKTVHAVQQEQLANPGCEASEASRPFDADRTGMVIGEGAGALVLEELESARSRGATIYGEVTGTGSSISADPGLQGSQEQAMFGAARSALSQAGISPTQLGHINAHGLSTTHCDAAEAKALGSLLESEVERIPVVAAKSYFGNLGAGSGVVELVASLKALGQGQLFRTLNYQSPDPTCPLAVTQESQAPAGGSFLKLNVTPQAQAAALVVSRVD